MEPYRFKKEKKDLKLLSSNILRKQRLEFTKNEFAFVSTLSFSMYVPSSTPQMFTTPVQFAAQQSEDSS
jgi:hypothetical protein